MTRAFLRLAPTTAAAALLASPAFAQGAKIDGADTAWMISATGLVLMMTIPGLALFYAGMVRKKNVLATMAQSLTATFLVSILVGAHRLQPGIHRRRRVHRHAGPDFFERNVDG
jgi:Amt family ammonium transporter